MFKQLLSLIMFTFCALNAEILDLDVVSYEKLIQEDPQTLEIIVKALHDKGIVGVKGVPGFKESFKKFIESSRQFNALPENIKETYCPQAEIGETPCGYEIGKEQFQLPNGNWVIDNLKASFYAYVPDCEKNKWPKEVNIQEPFQELGKLMANTGELIMYKMGILDENTGFVLKDDARIGRMLYYHQSQSDDNPNWCGTHFDHGLFTVILPAVYFQDDQQIQEPKEAGLFIRNSLGEPFKKVQANDLDVMMFQVGEFGQLVTNDKVQATEHCVHKAYGAVERYTFALFFNAPMDIPIYSQSSLTQDARYGGQRGEPCTYRQWSEASFKRYIVKD